MLGYLVSQIPGMAFNRPISILFRQNHLSNLRSVCAGVVHQPSAGIFSTAKNLSSDSIKMENCSSMPIGVVEYDYIKDLPNHPEKLLIDVRQPEELKETGQIPTSINIPLNVVEQELSFTRDSKTFESQYQREKPNECTEVIFTCRSGKRALQAAGMAVTLGYKNVKTYQGSWIDWAKHEGL